MQEQTRTETTEIESIWLTKGSVKPVWLAVTLLGTLAGLFAFWPLMLASGVASIWIALAWLADARAESNELPRY